MWRSIWVAVVVLLSLGGMVLMWIERIAGMGAGWDGYIAMVLTLILLTLTWWYAGQPPHRV